MQSCGVVVTLPGTNHMYNGDWGSTVLIPNCLNKCQILGEKKVFWEGMVSYILVLSYSLQKISGAFFDVLLIFV
jgi:hypothetical protein